MTNKEWLNRGWKLLMEIESLEKTKEKAILLWGKEKSAEYVKSINSLQKEQLKVHLQIITAINRLPDRTDRRILQLRYLAYCSHEDIATIMGYDETRSVARRIDAAAERIIQCR